MKFIFKIIGSITLITLSTLWLLNPSYSSFKQYAPDWTSTKRKVIYSRVKNYLVYSVYEKTVMVYDPEDQQLKEESSVRYRGFLLNFFKIE
jgi:hypothetical protein